MRVLIVEQRYDGGHYFNSVRHLIQAFAPLGCEIVLAVPSAALESPQFKIHLSPHKSSFRLEFIPSRDDAKSKWRTIRSDAGVFRKLIDRIKPDAVYVPTIELMAQSFAWWLALHSRLSRPHCEALFLGVPAAYGMRAAYGMGRHRPFFTRMAVRAMPFDVVHYIDPVAFEWVLNKVGGKAGRRARFIADPVEPL